MTDGSVVADAGSDMGILSKLFLDNGYRVLGIEPNDEMRGIAEKLLGRHPRFESVAGAAEVTTLANGSVDLVVAGNSFRGFDHDATRTEFRRILKPGGRIAVVWNVSRKSDAPFLEDLEKLLSEHRTDDSGVGTASDDDIYKRTETFFFSAGYFETARFPNTQPLDLEDLKGLVLSYSNVPAEDEPGSEAMLHELEEVFRVNELGSQVVMEYVVRVYLRALIALRQRLIIEGCSRTPPVLDMLLQLFRLIGRKPARCNEKHGLRRFFRCQELRATARVVDRRA